jgi:hypothetical protein
LLGANPTSTNAGPAPTGYTVIAGGYTVLSTNRAHALSLNFNPNGIIPGITTPAIPNGTLTLAATDGAGATGTINVGPDAASGVTLAVDNTATSGNLVYRFDGTADSGKIANYAGLSVQRSNPSAGSVKAELLSTTKTPRLTLDTTNGVQLDVKQKALLVDYSVTTPLPTLSGYVSTGKNGGTWNGPGIMTSDPDAQGGVTSLATVVAAEASDALGLTTGQTRSFRSQTVDDTTAIVAYVYRGDANLDGKINADDYFAIDSNYNKSGVVTGFIHGDFNEDGLINGDDYAMIDMNYSSHPGPLGGSLPPGGVSAVPEPSMMGACAAALSLLTSRRRRRTV